MGQIACLEKEDLQNVRQWLAESPWGEHEKQSGAPEDASFKSKILTFKRNSWNLVCWVCVWLSYWIFGWYLIPSKAHLPQEAGRKSHTKYVDCTGFVSLTAVCNWERNFFEDMSTTAFPQNSEVRSPLYGATVSRCHNHLMRSADSFNQWLDQLIASVLTQFRSGFHSVFRWRTWRVWESVDYNASKEGSSVSVCPPTGDERGICFEKG